MTDTYNKNKFNRNKNFYIKNIKKHKSINKSIFTYDGLCFQGGGLKGIVYLGVLKFLEENDLLDNIKLISGSSIGAIVSLLISLNYDYNFIRDWIMEDDFPKDIIYSSIEENKRKVDIFSDSLPIKTVKKIYSVVNYYGIEDNNKLQNIIRRLIADAVNRERFKSKNYINISKGEETFQELYEIFKKDILCTGTCVNTAKVAYFSRYHSPNMPVYIAVSISACFPFHFKPILWNGFYWIDGGTIQNLPIVVSQFYCKKILSFCIYNKPHTESLGDIKKVKWENLDDYLNKNSNLPWGAPPRTRKESGNTYDDINSFQTYLEKVFTCLSNAQVSPCIPYDKSDDVVEIEVESDINVLSSYIDPRIKIKYINVGYDAIYNFFK